jgi:hypothetical protein
MEREAMQASSSCVDASLMERLATHRTRGFEDAGGRSDSRNFAGGSIAGELDAHLL